MTDSVDSVETVETVETVDSEVAPIVTVSQTGVKDLDKIKEEHIKLQGKKTHTKKKVNKLTHTEAVAELQRLKKGSHQQSSYYKKVEQRIVATTSV